MRILAKKFALSTSTVQRRAQAEHWTALRAKRDASLLADLVPPSLPATAPLSIGPVPEVSAEWLGQRQRAHYRDFTALVDQAKSELQSRLSAAKGMDALDLSRVVTALDVVERTHARLFGIPDGRKPRRRMHSSPARASDYTSALGTLPTAEPAEETES